MLLVHSLLMLALLHLHCPAEGHAIITWQGHNNAYLQVRAEASAYWWLRAALAPLTLLNMALSGILQVRLPNPILHTPL